MSKDDLEKWAEILENYALSCLSDTYQKHCRCWEAALKLLEEAKSKNVDKDKLEDLEEVKERLYRVYYITSELYSNYNKLTKSDKWEVEYPSTILKRF